jgi:hypothetical protein
VQKLVHLIGKARLRQGSSQVPRRTRSSRTTSPVSLRRGNS